MSSSSKQHRAVLRYVRRIRRELGLPHRCKCFNGWHQNFHAPSEQMVMRAPARIGHLVALWWDIRMKLFLPSCAGDERAHFGKVCVQVRNKIDTEIHKSLRKKKHRKLQLRNNGFFVRKVTERVWPISDSVPNKKTEGPVS